MSEWTVENGHIDVLVNAARTYGVLTGDYQEVGEDLWRENYRSVNHRYTEREWPPAYVLHTTEATLHPVAVLKAIGCYEYQSCEHPAWETSGAHDLCQRLREAILARHRELARQVPAKYPSSHNLLETEHAYRSHPVYDSAPWGFTDLLEATENAVALLSSVEDAIPEPVARDRYVAPKEISAQVRANVRAAQKRGDIDRKWKISVRTELGSMCAEVAVTITGDGLTDEFLFVPEDERAVRGAWTQAAKDLAACVRACMEPAEQWSDGQMHFAFLYFRAGLMAP